MGEAPALYRLETAAKWLGVAPWDLLERPSYWFTSALDYRQAEIEAAAEKKKIEES